MMCLLKKVEFEDGAYICYYSYFFKVMTLMFSCYLNSFHSQFFFQQTADVCVVAMGAARWGFVLSSCSSSWGGGHLLYRNPQAGTPQRVDCLCLFGGKRTYREGMFSRAPLWPQSFRNSGTRGTQELVSWTKLGPKSPVPTHTLLCFHHNRVCVHGRSNRGTLLLFVDIATWLWCLSFMS